MEGYLTAASPRGRCPVEGKGVEAIARKYSHCEDFLYLGRGIHYPVALEGALKLKEISYIHAEGYPAGEMKHGPIALIDEDCPTVVVLPKNELYEKVLNNLEEVKARDGKVIAVVNYGDTEAEKVADDLLYVPESSPFLNPILMTVPLAAAGLSCGRDQGDGRGSAPKPREERHRRVTAEIGVSYGAARIDPEADGPDR